MGLCFPATMTASGKLGGDAKRLLTARQRPLRSRGRMAAAAAQRTVGCLAQWRYSNATPAWIWNEIWNAGATAVGSWPNAATSAVVPTLMAGDWEAVEAGRWFASFSHRDHYQPSPVVSGRTGHQVGREVSGMPGSNCGRCRGRGAVSERVSTVAEQPPASHSQFTALHSDLAHKLPSLPTQLLRLRRVKAMH